MKSVTYIYLMLIFFVYIIFCSIVYMLFDEYKDKRFNQRVAKLTPKFGNMVLLQLRKLQKGEQLTENELDMVKGRLKNKAYEWVFNEVIVSYNLDLQNTVYIKKYMSNFELYIKKLIMRAKKEGGVKGAHVAYLLGQYRLNKDYIHDFLYESLKSDSLYLRFNALKSIGQIGNVQSFVKALSYVSLIGGYLNDKVLIDVLGAFGGNKQELNSVLFLTMTNFSDEIQCILIDYFKNSNNTLIAAKLVNILSAESTNKEVKIRIIKYFSIINYPPAQGLLIELLSSDHWEYRAIAAKALGKYYSDEIIEHLLISITDANWYVRFNSAMSLLDFDWPEQILELVYDTKDKYAIDMLFYAMFVKEKITYQEYAQLVNNEVAVTV